MQPLLLPALNAVPCTWPHIRCMGLPAAVLPQVSRVIEAQDALVEQVRQLGSVSHFVSVCGMRAIALLANSCGSCSAVLHTTLAPARAQPYLCFGACTLPPGQGGQHQRRRRRSSQLQRATGMRLARQAGHELRRQGTLLPGAAAP